MEMDCRSFRAELRRLIDDSWDLRALEATDAMIAHAGGCASCRARLAAARALHGPDPGSLEVPAGLVDRTLARIESEHAHAARRTGAARNASRDRTLPFMRSTRRRLPVLPLVAAAALLVVITATVTVAVVAPRAGTVEVRLVLNAPGAQSVAVAGDWNGWNVGAQELRDDDGDGLWEVRFRVEAGREYEYQFVIDGSQWESDPLALLQVDDGFGGTNSVLDI